MRNKPRTEPTRDEATTELPAAPHLSHLLGRLGRSVSVHVWSVYQQVDQRSTLRSQSHVCFWTIAKVNERDVDEGCAFSFWSNGQLVQFDIHENSLDKNTRLKSSSSIFLSTMLRKPRKPREGWALAGSWLCARAEFSPLWPPPHSPSPSTALRPATHTGAPADAPTAALLPTSRPLSPGPLWSDTGEGCGFCACWRLEVLTPSLWHGWPQRPRARQTKSRRATLGNAVLSRPAAGAGSARPG